MKRDHCSIRTNVEFVMRDRSGRVTDRWRIHNTTKTAAKVGAADQLLDAPALGVPTHLAIGTATPQAATLGTEVYRNPLTSKERSGAVITMVADFAAGQGTGDITEAGVFDANSAGSMWLSSSFTARSKTSVKSLQVTWTLTFA